MSTEDDEDEFLKGNALIRATFGVNPESLDEEQWCTLFNEAIWLEGYRLRNMAKLIAGLQGEHARP